MGWSIHHPVGLIYNAPQQTYRGYTLFMTGGGDHATLVDMEGRICHRWHNDKGITYAYLLPNGNLLCRGYSHNDLDIVKGLGASAAELMELDWEGNVVWEYKNPMMHHDFARLPNGNTLVLLWEQMPAELSSQVRGGVVSDDDPDQLLGDTVQEIAPDGSVVNEWKLWEQFEIDEDIVCPLENRREWGHGNSLNVTSDGDLLVSFRRTDTVGIVNRETGKFTWKWGPGDVRHQHHPTYLDNGNVLIFDNGCHGVGYAQSRIVEIDPKTNEIAWEYQGSPPPSFYAHHISSAERQPNGNTLICEGPHGRYFEVTNNKDIVWEYINPFFYPDSRSDSISNTTFRAHRYGVDHPALKGKDLDPDRYANVNRLYAGR